MITRSITYASVSDMAGAQTIFSAAETWGQLKNENADIGAKAMKMKPWIKGENGAEGYGLTSEATKLPEGNFVLYFLVDKNDSGNYNR